MHETKEANTIEFLRGMQSFIAAIDSNCKIELNTEDPQRERIYKRAFEGKKNIRIVHKTPSPGPSVSLDKSKPEEQS